MNPNPYAAPNAHVADVPAPDDPAAAVPTPFFAVSRTKLLVLSVCTMGLYTYYWIYMNWKSVRRRTRKYFSPIRRTVFAQFFCYPLFNRIRKFSPEVPGSRFAAGPLAAAWIVLTLVPIIPGPLGLLGLFAPVALLPVQAASNAVNQAAAPRHDPNSRFSAWNWVGVAVGGPLLLVVIVGAFLPTR
jgi:hypothetical protein